jgi:hypothetical protein
MSFGMLSSGKLLKVSFLVAFLAALALLTSKGPNPFAASQVIAQSAGNSEQVARGKYIVEDVAMCGTCHTPRLADGQLDRSRWLAGAPVPYLPAQPVSHWPINAPRLAGTPPTSNEGMITLLTTAVWIDGKPLDDPMPHFHMTRPDAEAVVAYLRSLR